ncbi:MAG: FtsK/SpoIIIE domain-containing protein, partial [Acidimicrobiales bacterium]
MILEPAVTVQTLAETIARRDPAATRGSQPKNVTLAVVTASGEDRLLPANASVAEAALQNGSVVRVAESSVADGHSHAPTVAVLRVIDGPDVGREFQLPRGTAYIGRDRWCDVQLNDPLVSKRHAKLHLTSVAELVDTNSSNGILVDSEPVQRVLMRPDDVVVLGDSAISVTFNGVAAATNASGGTTIDFNRSPRLEPYFQGCEFDAPELPERAKQSKLPLIPLLVPVIMGAGLFAITRSMTSIAFIALSPLMLLGNFMEGRITGSRGLKRDLAGFRAELASLEEDLSSSAASERAGRLKEQPSASELIEAVARLTSLVWCRRPSADTFLVVRLGTGSLPSRTSVRAATDASRRAVGGAELGAIVDRYASISDVPVVANLRGSGSLGIAGSDAVALDVARNVIVQLAGLHSPADVILTAVASPASAPTWDFMKWLPHSSSPSSPLASPHLAVGRSACLNLIAEIEELITSRRGRQTSTEVTPETAVVLVVENDASIERSRLVAIAEEGFRCGVHVVWRSDAVDLLPAACRVYVTTEPLSGASEVVFVDDGLVVSLSTWDQVDLPTAERMARDLSPVIDAGAGIDKNADLPSSVSFMNLVGSELGDDPGFIIERWQESNSIVDRSGQPLKHRSTANTLRAVLGQSDTDTFYVDLRTHGPHALVGGTTGAGKSELLQAWILGMAAAHSPDRVTFLLVDYKGGSAFGECSSLPHTVGMVTDLSVHLARRALTSLVAELRYRERILSQRRAKDLIDLERAGDPDAPPSLVIVIDEFAALVQELPEFVEGVVNVAQRGRSLGLHLILATQRPTGVIKDNLRANTNLRIALRMADEADSSDVLGTSIAATFDPELPGRAAAKLGPGRLAMFQTAYAGGWTSSTPPPPDIRIEELRFGGGASWDDPPTEASDLVSDRGPNDIRRIVATIGQAAKQAAIPAPRKPWLEDLAPIYDLAKLQKKRLDTELVFGVRDEPDSQQQPVAAFLPDKTGNMAVYGTGGSGKSTVLRTLAMAAGLAIRGGPCQVYGLDFGARGLHMLEELPHVGSIVSGDDRERIERLLRRLRGLIDERATRYAKVRAGSVAEYRKLANAPDEPRVLLLVDGIGMFRQTYEVGENQRLFETFVGIATDGRPLGIHVIVTADRASAMPTSLGSTMQERLILRMANENDLAMLGVPADLFAGDTPPGRGFIGEDEVQVAVFGGSANLGDQAAAIAEVSFSIRRAGIATAPSIERLREVVRLTELP